MIWDVTLRKQLRHGESRFDLDVAFASDASRLVLFGPSGAGKTQTLKMLAGIVRPDRGRVVIAGRVLYDDASGVHLTPQQRRLAYMFQDYALFPHLNVRQNIAFARQRAGRGWLNPPRGLADEAVDRWIDAFDLQAIAGHYPHQISGGQRQRTALARALVLEPTALLLDEPFAALDRGLRQSLREELRELQAQVGLPMLLITHDEDDVEALADEVVHVLAGHVAAPLRQVAIEAAHA
jgi:molybdate transport system ATP-binding protein